MWGSFIHVTVNLNGALKVKNVHKSWNNVSKLKSGFKKRIPLPKNTAREQY